MYDKRFSKLFVAALPCWLVQKTFRKSEVMARMETFGVDALVPASGKDEGSLVFEDRP